MIAVLLTASVPAKSGASVLQYNQFPALGGSANLLRGKVHAAVHKAFRMLSDATLGQKLDLSATLQKYG